MITRVTQPIHFAPKRDCSACRLAFTLIELLVVISIIALLISILLPALHGARVAARNAADLSNIRQMAIAMISYSADHNGLLPPGDSPTQARSLVWIYTATWDDLENNYGVPEEGFACNTTETLSEAERNAIHLYNKDVFGTPYSIMGWNYLGGRNSALAAMPYPADSGGGNIYRSPQSLEDIDNITSRTLLTCIIYNAASPGKSWESIAPHTPGNDAKFIPSGAAWIDPDGLNVAKIDGSAAFTRFQELTAVGGGDWYYFLED